MQRERFDMVVFDVDGTLLDTSAGILSAVRKVIEEEKLPTLSEEQLRGFIGPPIQNSFANAYGISQSKANEMGNRFRKIYGTDEFLFQAIPYEGIYETFSSISAFSKITIATYKRIDYASRILDYFGFDRYTTEYYGSDFDGKLTKRDIILQAISAQRVSDFSKVLMIGDTWHDAKGAEELGVRFLGVTYGFGFKGENDLKGFPYIGIATTPKEICNFVVK